MAVVAAVPKVPEQGHAPLVPYDQIKRRNIAVAVYSANSLLNIGPHVRVVYHQVDVIVGGCESLHFVQNPTFAPDAATTEPSGFGAGENVPERNHDRRLAPRVPRVGFPVAP